VKRIVRVNLTPDEVAGEGSPFGLAEEQAVVVDVLRATTTIIQALASGAMAVVPCLSAEEARSHAGRLDPARVLLAGEKNGVKPPGFDLGNSPLDFSPTRVRGKSIVMGTTNGTRAILAVSGAGKVFAGAFVNLSALVKELDEDGNPVRIVCAGQHGQPCGEDMLFAGWLARELTRLPEPFLVAPDMGSQRALTMAGTMEPAQLPAALRAETHGQTLFGLGFGGDVEFAAALDSLPVVPQLRHDPFRLELIGPGPRTPSMGRMP
jgi:2-phosphosulfolactate phosphatase